MDSQSAEYFATATSWELDCNDALRKSAHRAWIIAGVALAMAGLSTVAVALMTPLKTVEPFVIRVDSTSGVVDIVPEYAGNADLPDAVLRFLAGSYVTQRERYVPALAETDYEQVGALQSAALNQNWAAAWARGNPDSPLNTYGNTAVVTVQIRSILFLKHGADGTAVIQVRFQRVKQSSPGSQSQLENFVATFSAAFGPPSKDLHTRTLNPLGFVVLDYRREPEVGDWGPSQSQSVVSKGVRQ